MARKRVNYVKVALSVLEELGGGPLSTKVLVEAAKARGLIEDRKWVYHNFSRKVRGSDLFDAWKRSLWWRWTRRASLRGRQPTPL